MIPIYDPPTARRTILRRRGPLETRYPPALLADLARLFGRPITPPEAVAAILREVQAEGDAALRRWSQRLDGFSGRDFRLPQTKLAQAFHSLDADLRAALELAAERIRAFHQRQPIVSWSTEGLGGRLGQRVTPIDRVGVYVPGGSAPLPSSLLMAVIPAQVAGVPQIAVCTPPNPHPAILAAAHLCGLEVVFQVGGAQAIAALAFGTESIPPVDKIVGPGNLFVTLAKQQVFGLVGVDGLAGPTETMVIADEGANPAWVTADLLAQAEHDPLATAILLTPDRSLAAEVQAEVPRQAARLARAEIIAQSLAQRGGIVLTPDLPSAIDLANAYAPEHLCLAVKRPRRWAEKVRHAGALFLGHYAFEVLGDYVAGPSHVLPTGGTARFSSGLSALDFVKFISLIDMEADVGKVFQGRCVIGQNCGR